MVSALLLEPVNLPLPMGKKILKAKEYKAYLDARDIIKRAEEKAVQIENDAKIAFEEEKQRGYQEGLKKGDAAIADKMIETIGKTIDYFAGVEEALVDVVILALKKILVEYDDKKLVKQLVKNALSVVRNQKHVTLRVHPDHKEYVQKNLGEIASSSPTIGYIEISGDVRVPKNGCIIDSDLGIVETDLEAQLAKLKNAMKTNLGKTKKGAVEPEKRAIKTTSEKTARNGLKKKAAESDS